MGAGQGRKQVGAQGGVPLPPFFQHQRVRPLLLAAPGPRPPGSCSEAALTDPRCMHPTTSSPLCFPSGEFFPPPSFLAVSWPSRSFPVTGQVGVTPQNRRLGAPGCQAGVGGLARLTLRAWRVRPSRGRPAASPPLPARLRPEASAGTDRTVFYNVSSSPAFLRGRAQPLCEVASEPPAITCYGSQIVFHFLPPIFKIDDMGSGFPESSLVF